MPKKKIETEAPAEVAEVTELQSFEMRTVHRSQIKLAEYNPRHIDRSARKKLKEKLSSVGLVEAPIWNEETGNLVGGHQRMQILDELEGSEDYEIDVAVVKLDPRREKEINIFLNNRKAQGSYNFDNLLDISNEIGFSGLEKAGFEFSTIQSVFGGDPKVMSKVRETAQQTGEAEEYVPAMFLPQNDPAKEEAEKLAEIAEIKQSYKKGRDKKVKEFDTEFFFVLNFQSPEHCEAFLEACNANEGERYVDGIMLADTLGVILPGDDME